MNLNELESPRNHMGMQRGLKTMQINATGGGGEALGMLFCLSNGSSLENAAVGRQAVHTKIL